MQSISEFLTFSVTLRNVHFNHINKNECQSKCKYHWDVPHRNSPNTCPSMLLFIVYTTWKLFTHFAKRLVDEIFVLLKKIANFANILQSFGVIFQRKYQRTCVYSTKTYVCNIKVLFEIYRMVLVWTPNSYVRCVLVRCEVTN